MSTTQFKIGFKVRKACDTSPQVKILVNKKDYGVYTLDTAGDLDDAYSDLQYINLSVPKQKCIQLDVVSSNIKQEYKINGDFGFQVSELLVNGNSVHFFGVESVVYRPGLENDLVCERGVNANYVNMPHGCYSVNLEFPLYTQFYKKHFRGMIMTTSGAPKTDIRETVIQALRQVYDPEISINVWDLGLIYELTIQDTTAIVKHTLTSMMCPFADQICQDIYTAVNSVDGINTVERELVWDPPFGLESIPEETRFALGWD